MTVQYISDLNAFWSSIVNYVYNIGFMIGCIFSERYYTSNVQKKAIYISYTLSMCSGISLALKIIFTLPSYCVAIGYTLSGIGQSWLIIVMVAYATPIIKSDNSSILLPIILGLLNFSGIVGATLFYVVKVIDNNTGYLLLSLNLLLLLVSYIISWNLKGIPCIYNGKSDHKPLIPFSNFSIVFYTYGVLIN